MPQTPQQIKETAIGKVNGVMTALDMYPESSTTTTLLSGNMSFNPMDLIVDFFKKTRGYDVIVDKVSYYISHCLEVLEPVAKGILLSNIQLMLSCSIKPIINRRMIQDGVVFDVRKIDLLNILFYSPLDKSESNPGRYYYFDCDDKNIIDDVKYSKDLNAVIWYATKTPNERIVWKKMETNPNHTILIPG